MSSTGSCWKRARRASLLNEKVAPCRLKKKKQEKQKGWKNRTKLKQEKKVQVPSFSWKKQTIAGGKHLKRPLVAQRARVPKEKKMGKTSSSAPKSLQKEIAQLWLKGGIRRRKKKKHRREGAASRTTQWNKNKSLWRKFQWGGRAYLVEKIKVEQAPAGKKLNSKKKKRVSGKLVLATGGWPAE